MKHVLLFFIALFSMVSFIHAVEGDVDPTHQLDKDYFPQSVSDFQSTSRDTVEVIIGTPVIGNVIPFWGASYNAARFQVLFLQSEINTAGDIVTFSFMPSSNTIGAYDSVRVYCCTTGVTQLSSTFDLNYGGNSPVEVMNVPSLLVGGSANVWMDWDISFPYNNIDNLLLEIRWRGDGGINVALFRTAEAVPRRAYAWDDNASTGSLQNTSNYVKLAISTPSGIQEKPVNNELASFGFAPNMPNPISGYTAIQYTTTKSGKASLKVYDGLGRLVRTFVDRSIEPAGSKTVYWNGKDDARRDVANGVYLIKLDAEDKTATHKMILVK